MQFYCPKCDLKYRIEDDKLTEQPNAQLRCKACHTVFSVQNAIKAAQQRVADARVPVDGVPNLSVPPPKPAPVSFKSTAPAVASTGKGVVTLPLLDVTARPRTESAKQVNAKAGLTKPSLAPNLGTLNIGPKITRRGVGASALLAAKSLRPTSDAASSKDKIEGESPTERFGEAESTPPPHVLGRGSAGVFPAVTREGTPPAVPPLPRHLSEPGSVAAVSQVQSQPAPPSRARSGPPSRPRRSRPAPSSLPVPNRRSSSSAEAMSKPRGTDEPSFEELDEELTPIESEAPITPVVATDPNALLHTADEVFGWPNSSPAPENESAELNEAVPHLPSPPADTDGPSAWLTQPINEQPMTLAAESAPAPRAASYTPFDSEPPFVAKRKTISLTATVAVALAASVVGFGAGYSLGTKSEQPASNVSVPTHEAERVVRVDAPPPPPEEEPREENAGPGAVPAQPEGSERTPRPNTRAGKPTAPQGMHDTVVSALATLEGPPNGPAVRSSDSQTANNGLNARAIEATVKRFQPGLKRACWQPLLNQRGGDVSDGARVSTTVTIAPTGRVVGVTHGGDPAAYPGLATCIAGKVQTWKFPRATTPTTAVIPFVFAVQ